MLHSGISSKVHGRLQLSNADRLFFVQLYRWFPSILKLITVVRPGPLVRWHREGFRRYWRWKSRPLGGRPPIGAELRALIRRMSLENPLLGAPRIHGELLKLGFAVAPSTVGKYMARKRNDDPSGQSWATFLRSHTPQIAAMDLFVVPTIGFNLLYALIIVRVARRELVWVNVTAHPTAEWIARQITEAFPWNEAPRYLIRDRDRIYGTVVRRRLRAMGIRDKPIRPVRRRRTATKMVHPAAGLLGLELDDVAELFQPALEVSGCTGVVDLVEVGLSQVAIGDSFGEHVIRGDEDLMGDGKGRAEAAAPGLEAVKLSLK